MKAAQTPPVRRPATAAVRPCAALPLGLAALAFLVPFGSFVSLMPLALFAPPAHAQGLAQRQGAAAAPAAPAPTGVSAAPAELAQGMAQWLRRLQRASGVSSYAGTFVVSSATGGMSSARIWHVCEGDVQFERIEALSGVPRATFRRNDEVRTFWPQSRVARTDWRDAAARFPQVLAHGGGADIERHYAVADGGAGRVAGFDADIVALLPRDAMRFGYRIWSERRTGLVIKTQTLDAQGHVLEQSAFSELQLQPPIKASQISRMMDDTHGWQLQKAERVRTTPEAEGWRLRAQVAGFAPQGFYRRAQAAGGELAQWIFSDGLATVSLFLQPFDARVHTAEGAAVMGATHTLARRLALADGAWWVTAVGEAPLPTLQQLIDALQRQPH